jgi:seryl-tRNA synthetase
MIDVRKLREDFDGVAAALARRGDPALQGLLAQAQGLERERRTLLVEIEAARSTINRVSGEIGAKVKQGLAVDADREAVRVQKDTLKEREELLRTNEGTLDTLLLGLPNFVEADVPDGGAEANRVVRTWGTPPTTDFTPKPHWELGPALGLFDLPAGAKITGSGFPVFTGVGAKLIRALSGFMLDLHTAEHGYLEVAPPYVVNRASLTATGQLPKFADEVYHAEIDDLFLIPTAEVPLTNMLRDEILDVADLPTAYCGWTPCFRREAGAAGKDTRGLIRVHQFDKVELVRFVKPEDGRAEHQKITAHAEAVLQRLGLPYRVLELAAGDTGNASAHTYDLEVWAPGVGTWLEVSSSSLFTDYQARRANIRFRREPKAKPEFVHTLNASGVAFPRCIIALLEHYQQADGSVLIPAPLQPYLGTDRLRARA